MDNILQKIQEKCSDYAICKDKDAYSLFAGRNLPTFVKDYILNRFSQGEIRDEEGIRNYLADKMPQNSIMMRLLEGEVVNVTTRVVISPKMDAGKVGFMLPDLNITPRMFVSSTILGRK